MEQNNRNKHFSTPAARLSYFHLRSLLSCPFFFLPFLWYPFEEIVALLNVENGIRHVCGLSHIHFQFGFMCTCESLCPLNPLSANTTGQKHDHP